MDSLVTTEWLAGELGANDLRIVDATYFAGFGTRDAAAEYAKAHIPGAVFMDLGEIADTSSDLPSMLPPPEKFASRMQSLGLGDGSRIVLYDDSPWKTAARAWWSRLGLKACRRARAGGSRRPPRWAGGRR